MWSRLQFCSGLRQHVPRHGVELCGVWRSPQQAWGRLRSLAGDWPVGVSSPESPCNGDLGRHSPLPDAPIPLTSGSPGQRKGAALGSWTSTKSGRPALAEAPVFLVLLPESLSQQPCEWGTCIPASSGRGPPDSSCPPHLVLCTFPAAGCQVPTLHEGWVLPA